MKDERKKGQTPSRPTGASLSPRPAPSPTTWAASSLPAREPLAPACPLSPARFPLCWAAPDPSPRRPPCRFPRPRALPRPRRRRSPLVRCDAAASALSSPTTGPTTASSRGISPSPIPRRRTLPRQDISRCRPRRATPDPAPHDPAKLFPTPRRSDFRFHRAA